MAVCRKMVEGGAVAFPCDLGLPEGHAGPCAAKEKPASVTKRAAWLAGNYPTESGYVEPRRAVELMVEPGSISKAPGQQADHDLPIPTPEPERTVFPDGAPTRRSPRPAQGEINRVIDYLLEAHAGFENWMELVRLREQLENVVQLLWQGRTDEARVLVETMVARLPSDDSE